MKKPWLTKVWLGRHWRYVHTTRRYWLLGKRKRWGITSYRRATNPPAGTSQPG